ncbi:MAG: type 4a pilus biogenesis protein PilO [Candidatus Nanopelagicales bacterium]
MTSTPRFWLISGILASLVLAVIGWNFLVSPRMEAVAQTRADTEELNVQTERTMAQVRQLRAQAEDLPAQIRTLERMQRRIPSSVNVPALLREVQRAAKGHGVVIDSLTPGQITVFTATGENAPDATSTSSDDPNATPDATAAPKPTPEATDLGQGSLPKGVGLSYVPITITATGDFPSVRAFTSDIEQLKRAYLITGLDLARGTDVKTGRDLSVTLETRVFVANDRLRNLPDKALDAVGSS